MITIKRQDGNEVTFPPGEVSRLELDHRHYMNGTDSSLIVSLKDGTKIRIDHGWSQDIYAIKKKIEAACA